MPRPRPPVDAEGYSRAVFHKRANYDGWARPEVIDPTGRQHPHKYVVRFAYYKSDGAEPGWHVSWNDNSECWMDDHEVEDDHEAMRVFAERAVDSAMAAQAARQAKYAEEALLRARLAKRLKNKEAAQAKTAAELEAEKREEEGRGRSGAERHPHSLRRGRPARIKFISSSTDRRREVRAAEECAAGQSGDHESWGGARLRREGEGTSIPRYGAPGPDGAHAFWGSVTCSGR